MLYRLNALLFYEGEKAEAFRFVYVQIGRRSRGSIMATRDSPQVSWLLKSASSRSLTIESWSDLGAWLT